MALHTKLASVNKCLVHADGTTGFALGDGVLTYKHPSHP